MYLFLDIDGVLNTYHSHGSWDGGHKGDPDRILLDRKAVHNLNLLLNTSPFRIVISSSWRHTLSLQTIAGIFRRNGISLEPESVTPELDEGERGEEILLWLKEHPGVPYLVLDDNIADIAPHIGEENLIHVKDGWETGLTEDHLRMAVEKIERLNTKTMVA